MTLTKLKVGGLMGWRSNQGPSKGRMLAFTHSFIQHSPSTCGGSYSGSVPAQATQGGWGGRQTHSPRLPHSQVYFRGGHSAQHDEAIMRE